MVRNCRGRDARRRKIVNVESNPAEIYSSRSESYVRFVQWVRYPQGLRAFFEGSPLLHSGLKVLDAGCGTGIVTLAFREALASRGMTRGALHAFDLTPAMLDRFRENLRTRGIHDVALVQADVLEPDALPETWRGYDLILSASMMEYLPRDRFVAALAGLRSLLNEGGTLLLFITRRNWLMKPLIGDWWDANLYSGSELAAAFRRAGFAEVAFRSFPVAARHLALWGHIVEAREPGPSTGTGSRS
jgi:ubiquinone/menaquinone biosynthesis C-methylase UbiE